MTVFVVFRYAEEGHGDIEGVFEICNDAIDEMQRLMAERKENSDRYSVQSWEVL